jgi:hypothetical protein
MLKNVIAWKQDPDQVEPISMQDLSSKTLVLRFSDDYNYRRRMFPDSLPQGNRMYHRLPQKPKLIVPYCFPVPTI